MGKPKSNALPNLEGTKLFSTHSGNSSGGDEDGPCLDLCLSSPLCLHALS